MSSIGSSCNLNLSTDVIVPGFIKEGRRTVISAFNLHVLDAGSRLQRHAALGIMPADLRLGRREHLPHAGRFRALAGRKFTFLPPRSR